MAGKTYSAGTIFLQVVPVFGDTMRAIEREAKDANRNVSKDLENSLAEGADRGSRRAADKLHENLVDGADKAGKDSGDKYAGAFETRFKRAIDGAEKEMKRLDFKTASDESLRNLDRIKSKLAELKDIDIDVDLDAKKALAELAAVRKMMDSLIDGREINVGFNMREAMRDLEAMEKRVERFVNERRVIEPELNLRQAERAMGVFEKTFRAHAKRAADSLGDSMHPEIQKIRAELASLGDTDIGIDLDAGAAMAQAAALQARLEALAADDLAIDVVIDAARARAELVTLQAQMSRIDGNTLDVRADVDTAAATAQLGLFARAIAAVDGRTAGVRASVDNTGNSFRAFNVVILAVTTLLPALVPILAAVAGGLLALGPAAIAAGAGLGVMVLGFSGIGNALQALGAQQKSAGRDALQAEKTMRGAAQGVADAQRSLARARQQAGQRIEDAAQGVADAERNSSRQIQDALRAEQDAHRQAAQAIQSALRQQADAERALADAQRDATQAQQDLREARAQAQKDLDDVADRQRQNALDIRQAQIDLFNATVANNAAQADGGATNLEREQAAIDLGNATERLHELREAQRDLNTEREKGVKGNAGVQSAEDALAQALDSRADAARNLADAERAVQEARLQGARQIQEAERNLARARADGARATQDAEDNLAQARADGAQSVADAQRGLQRAQETYQDALYQTGVLGSTAMQNVRDAMDKLGPSGRKFVRFLFGLRDEFYKIRDAAQAGMLPGVTRAIETIMGKAKNFTPFIRRMARAVGDLFEEFANSMTGPGMRPFMQMMDDMGPKLLRLFGRVLIRGLEVFAQLMVIAAPFAERLLTALVGVADNALAFLKSKDGMETMRQFFEYAFKVGPKVWKFVKDLWKAFLNIAEALAPIGELIMQVVDGFLQMIAAIPPTVLRFILVGIIALVIAFQVMVGTVALLSAGLGLLTFILTTGWIGIGVLIIGIVIAIVAAFVALYTSSETFRDIVNSVFHAVGVAIRWVWEHVIQPAIQGFWDLVVLAWHGIQALWKNVLHPVLNAIMDAIQWLWEHVVSPVLHQIWDLFDGVFHVIRWLWHNILWPVLDLIFTVVWWLLRQAVRPVLGMIEDVWHATLTAMEWVWDHILHPVFNAISDALGWLRDRFDTVVGAIGRLWHGLQDLLAAPIRFVIDTVLNHGLIDAFNWVATKVGSDKMGYIPLPNFAQKKAGSNGSTNLAGVPGGTAHAAGTARVLPGYTPGRDVHHFTSPTGGRLHLSGGEAIMVPEFTAAVGEEQINYWNSLFRRKGKNAVREAFYARGGVFGRNESYATGGVRRRRVWPVPGHDTGTYPGHDGVDINRGSGSDDYGDPIWAADDGVISYAGTARGYGNAVFERGYYGELVYGHMSQILAHIGQSVKAGDLIGRVGSTGHSTAPHLHFGFPGGTTAQALAFLAGASVQGGDMSGGSSGGGFHMPGWVSALGKPLEWLLDRLPLDKLDKYAKVGEIVVDGVKMVAGDVAEKIGDMVDNFTDGLRDAASAVGHGIGKAWDFITPGGGSVQDTVQAAAAHFGWDTGSQWSALSTLISHESGWNPNAQNPTSSAYGLFQFLDSTWGAYGASKTSDPGKQAVAGLNYIRQRYGSPVGAWDFWQAHNWYEKGGVYEGPESSGIKDNGTMMYDSGGYLPPGLTTVVNLTGKPEPVFTAGQFASMQRGGGQGGGGTTIDIDVNGSNLTGEDVANEFLWAIRNVENGGVYAGLVGNR